MKTLLERINDAIGDLNPIDENIHRSLTNTDIDSLKREANLECVRRLIVRFFVEKGYPKESFNSRRVNPCMLQSLPTAIPQLIEKIEISPAVVECSQLTGRATLSWSLFVLGCAGRMYLGDTYHNDMGRLATQIQNGQIMVSESDTQNTRRTSTPREIIRFILRVLSKHESGYVPLTAPIIPLNGQLGYGAGIGITNASSYAPGMGGGGII